MAYDNYYSYYPRYVSVAEKRAKALRKLQQLRKKNPNLRPVVVEGRTLARTWWGKAWNRNLERYADYRNRIGRGRSYVCHGAVLDLQIAPGEVRALVQGTRSAPYNVVVRIQPIGRPEWKQITHACSDRIGSMQELLAGRFPKDLAEVFTVQGGGLFPSPKEIRFECSCPDWASMCKHVAAVLYGIGKRLDEDPRLFFVLRKADVNDLVAGTVRDTSERLLKQARRKTGRVIEDADLGEVFGIELDGPATPKIPSRTVKPAKPRTPRTAAQPKDPKRRTPSTKGRKVRGRLRIYSPHALAKALKLRS